MQEEILDSSFPIFHNNPGPKQKFQVLLAKTDEIQEKQRLNCNPMFPFFKSKLC